MKKIIAFILTLIPLCSISAQELFVCDFKHVPEDVSAAIYQVKDANGDPCALIKVGTTATNPTFEGNIVKSEDKGVIVTAVTPFYAEMGGQVGDTGVIYNDNFRAKVVDTKKNIGGNRGFSSKHKEN